MNNKRRNSLNFKVKFNNDESVVYDTEEKFISDLFSLLIGNQFFLSNLSILQENFLKALELVSDLISQQKASCKEIKPALLVSKEHKRELSSYNTKLTKLSNRIKQVEKSIMEFTDIMEFKKYIYGQILTLNKMSNLPGFILGETKGTTTFGNAEIQSFTTRPKFQL